MKKEQLLSAACRFQLNMERVMVLYLWKAEQRRRHRPGFTRNGTSLESTTTYSRSSVWILLSIQDPFGVPAVPRWRMDQHSPEPVDTIYRRCIPTAEWLPTCLR
ncbi:hypothetical protein ILYODFUR_024976 [Ilyodon furcidens]|uniref:Uncharacterized protein n=1 Tax=Ilyodon furcidens TaxID=33524 RepID=A0ABV0VID0_9TELE